jgi:hypothetical protein
VDQALCLGCGVQGLKCRVHVEGFTFGVRTFKGLRARADASKVFRVRVQQTLCSCEGAPW